MAETRVERQLRAEGDARPGTRRLGWLLLALALGLVAVVGLGSGRALWDVGGPPRLVEPRDYAGDLVVVGFALLVVTPLVIRALRRRRRRGGGKAAPDVPPVRLRWWGRALVALAIGCAVFVSLLLLTLLPASRSENERGGADSQAGTTSAAASADRGRPPVHWWGIAALVVVVAGGAALAWRLREPRPEPAEAEPETDEAEELLDALDLSLEDLEAEPDPRLAVIRAYARMERALAAHGLGRRPTETPLEYLARALGSLRVGRPSVERLSALFERAKFSQHEIDPTMKTDALQALAALRAELAAGQA